MKDFVVSRYKLRSPKIKDEVRFVFLSDLHGIEYGTDNVRLLQAVREARPDAVLIGGDMIVESDRDPLTVSLKLTKVLADEYPVFAANGNHEHRLSDEPGSGYRYGLPPSRKNPGMMASLREVYEMGMEDAGAVMLFNENAIFEKGDTKVRIWGLDIDRKYFPRGHNIEMQPEAMDEYLGMKEESDSYDILLAHHPNYVKAYAAWGADCVLSGHIHGGAIRLPGVGGLLSPNFTFFPRYSKGCYHEGDCRMIVSAGLGTHTINWRLNNPPELIVLRLVPGDI